jgi:exodeoxyribonuclease VII small subunit
MKGQGHAWSATGREGDSTPREDLGLLGLKSSLSPEIPMSKPPFESPASYEAAMEELEQLTARIESGQLPLEQLLAGYERGAELLKFCRDKLQAVEEQIKVLDAGVLKPWANNE